MFVTINCLLFVFLVERVQPGPAKYMLTKVHNQHFILNVECTPPRGEVCVEIRICPYFANLLDSSPIPRPRRIIQEIRESQCGFIGNNPRVCCTLAKTTTQSSVFDESKTTETSISDHDSDILPRNCGSVGTHSRILLGTDTEPFEFPWMALIAFNTQSGVDFKCSGTIISKNYILTAAHCVLHMPLAGVRLGEHNLNTEKDCDFVRGLCSTVQDLFVESVIIHPSYKKDTFHNDIALLKLATTANFSSDNIRPICLPRNPQPKTLYGKFAVVTGWGVTENGYKSPTLLKVDVPVIPTDECEKIYRNDIPIGDSQICAGGHLGRDSCGSDSGGPLKSITMVDGTPKYVQYGIVSFGPKQCGTKGRPGVYTNIVKYMDWILETLKQS